MPILISNTGLPIYNTTKVVSVPVNTSFYLWPVEPIDFTATTEDKIFVTAVNVHGCLGNASNFIIKRVNKAKIHMPDENKVIEKIRRVTIVKIGKIL